MMKKILAICIVCSLAGCSGEMVAHSLSYKSVMNIQPKLTTQGEVLILIGTPLSSDMRKWYYESSALAERGGRRRLVLVLDFLPDMKVDSYLWKYDYRRVGKQSALTRLALAEKYLSASSPRFTLPLVAESFGAPNKATPDKMLYEFKTNVEKDGSEELDCRLFFRFDHNRYLAGSFFIDRKSEILLSIDMDEKLRAAKDEMTTLKIFGPPAVITDGVKWYWRLESEKLLNINFDNNRKAKSNAILPARRLKNIISKKDRRFARL